MDIFTEEERLDEDEMLIRIISASEDKLPFRVAIKCPDPDRHDLAHIMRLGTKDDELGAFVITDNTPKFIEDLVEYTEGDNKGLKNFTNERLQALVDWVSRRNFLMPECTNWRVLQGEYAINRKSFSAL
jgi:hypothetical protein